MRGSAAMSLSPCALHPVPCTPYPLPCTLYPVPCTPYPLPSTLYPLPPILNPQSSTLCPQPSTLFIDKQLVRFRCVTGMMRGVTPRWPALRVHTRFLSLILPRLSRPHALSMRQTHPKPSAGRLALQLQPAVSPETLDHKTLDNKTLNHDTLIHKL